MTTKPTISAAKPESEEELIGAKCGLCGRLIFLFEPFEQKSMEDTMRAGIINASKRPDYDFGGFAHFTCIKCAKSREARDTRLLAEAAKRPEVIEEMVRFAAKFRFDGISRMAGKTWTFEILSNDEQNRRIEEARAALKAAREKKNLQ